MDSQLTGRVESLVTFGAPERSLVAVRSEVHRSRVVCPKMLRALGAWVRPFPRVVADVALQVASLSETFPTMRTQVRLRSDVCSLMGR